MLQYSMENWKFVLYKPMASCAGRANIKNGTGPSKDPCRWDIAPTGELAGLPARDAPKSSEVLASLARSEACEILLRP